MNCTLFARCAAVSAKPYTPSAVGQAMADGGRRCFARLLVGGAGGRVAAQVGFDLSLVSHAERFCRSTGVKYTRNSLHGLRCALRRLTGRLGRSGDATQPGDKRRRTGDRMPFKSSTCTAFAGADDPASGGLSGMEFEFAAGGLSRAFYAADRYRESCGARRPARRTSADYCNRTGFSASAFARAARCSDAANPQQARAFIDVDHRTPLAGAVYADGGALAGDAGSAGIAAARRVGCWRARRNSARCRFSCANSAWWR